MAGLKGKSFLNCSVYYVAYSFYLFIEMFIVYSRPLNRASFFGISWISRVWWPFFVVIFYVISPLPVLIANRYLENTNTNTTTAKDVALFITAVIVISAYGLPIILARAPPDHPTIVTWACILALMGNTVVFLTILGFFYSFTSNESSGLL
ncbi:Leptin receptor overlapping transcript-like 1 [Sarcoptes scabiei]|uniref:Leptin receptor overlapping transcript-like 1 n=1 Tax=Sarcoptes scabiei TaxID=52283 RepID=A0A834R840_SARSC|nr:Leptin receptor overlapping transcript-like 1 [Sarcoptes scabiei]